MARRYGNRWETVEKLPSGGQAEVFRVRDLHDKSKSENWVLKRLRNLERMGRFEREVRILQELDSAHIPKIQDHSFGETAYIVTPYLGSNFERHPNRKSLTIEDILRLFEQLVEAIEEAHRRGIAHRDIKPNNIILNDDSSNLYLIDFGISKFADDKLALTNDSEPFGNPAFSAPECFLGRNEEPSFSADIYSLGKLLYWMVSYGNHIHRENLTDDALHKIQTNYEYVRFYIELLLRGTIREESNQRWDATTLLQGVQNTRGLIKRYKTYIENGSIPIYDGFGLNDTFNATSFRSATMPPQGNPPADSDIGTAFLVPQGSDLQLESVHIALKLMNGANKVDIWLTEDDGIKPSNDKIIESFSLNNILSHSGSIISIPSIRQPVLQAGATYWLIISVPLPDSNVALLSSPLEFIPRKVIFAERYNSRDWEVKDSRSGPGYAFRILAHKFISDE